MRVRATGSVHTKTAELCTHAITSAVAPSCEWRCTSNPFEWHQIQRYSQHRRGSGGCLLITPQQSQLIDSAGIYGFKKREPWRECVGKTGRVVGDSEQDSEVVGRNPLGEHLCRRSFSVQSPEKTLGHLYSSRSRLNRKSVLRILRRKKVSGAVTVLKLLCRELLSSQCFLTPLAAMRDFSLAILVFISTVESVR